MSKPRLFLLGILFGLEAEALGQPVATSFVPPVQPASGYYNANLFLQLTPGRGYHMGEDLNGNKGGSTDFGDPVYPSAVGKVVTVYNPSGPDSWGPTVCVEHLLPNGKKIYTIYAHLSKILVKLGQIVYPYQILGNIGDANGYYKKAAHLHSGYSWMRWTPTSPGYYKTLTVAVAQKYLDPSLFIDDRDGWSVNFDANPGSSFISSNIDLEISNYSPVSLSYATMKGKTISLAQAITAGWIDPTVHIWDTSDNSWAPKSLSDFVFAPNQVFAMKFFKRCRVTIVSPGHNFQSSRARQDMIKAAARKGLTRVKLETFTDLGNDGTLAFDLRSLCFDNGSNTSVSCAIQATGHDNPLLRYVVWFDPIADAYLDDWSPLDPTDID